ncbi:MAG: hypothetical protein KatS3mg076_0454 [Candidatus Binatia bacterium]|nr:MAG: hypothetical protein KatS3mg076_0454 [Candidatus Binatia bacterium]
MKLRPLDSPADLRSYYRRSDVVEDYLRRRTGHPLGRVLHTRQVEILRSLLDRYGPRAVLEIAPGPARLTAELPQVRFGVAVEFSEPMLAEARTRLGAASCHGWQLVRADAFSLPLRDASVDFAYSFRFVRHFSPADRERLYGELRRVLRPGGILVLDAPNRRVREPARVARQPIFDELYTEESLEAELAGSGFSVVELLGSIRHPGLQRKLNRLRRLGLGTLARFSIRAVEIVPSRNPSFWVVVARRM